MTELDYDKLFDKFRQYMSYDDASDALDIVYDMMISTAKDFNWIPIKTRPLTEEEKEEFAKEFGDDVIDDWMYDCILPEDGEDVLVTTRSGEVCIDTFCRDWRGCYFETYCDEDDLLAWAYLPEPYKGE